MSPTLFCAARLAITAGALAVGPAVLALDMPNLSGTWQLNRDASDDPQKMMKEARASSGRGGFSGGSGVGRGGHGHGGGSWRGGRGGDASDAGDLSDRFAALNTLEIRHVEPALTITDAAGRERVLYTDGRKTEEEHSHGGTTAVTASWKDGHLEVVSRPENGGKIVETFAATADGSQLTVTTKMEGTRGQTLTIRRVYDAVRAGAPKPTPPARRERETPPPVPLDEDDQSV